MWRPPRSDVALAAGLAAVQVGVTYVASRHQPDREVVDLAAAALLVAGPAALIVRRRYPVGTLVAAFVATHVYVSTDYGRGPVFLALIVALVNAVLAGRRAVAWGSLAVGYVSDLWFDRPSLVAAVALAAWLLVLGVGAELLRVRQERAADARRRRIEEERARASEERLRIARELHDVVAHNLSLINVQAGVALHLLAEHPEQAQTALAAIKQASKEGLDEVRSVLDVLRATDDDAPRAPTPGLAELDVLIERTEEAGVAVTAERTGAVRPLPPPVERAAFRIVQESLTNVVRHAGPARATVRIEYGPDDVVIQVDDDGRAAVNGHTPGNGLAGMRERTTALGGRFDAGPRPQGGFRVRAWIPVEPGESGG